MDVEELEWSKSTETLEDLLKNPRVKLPQLIKLATGLEFLDSKASLQAGQLLNVLSKRTISYVGGTDSRGKSTSLPLSCPYAVQLKVSPHNERTFNSVKDITDNDPLPKFVEVTKIGSSLLQEQCVTVGDILKVVFVEKSGHLPCFVHFRNSVGTHIKIDINEDIAFQVAINYSSNILLASLFEQYNREFPAFIQFCKQDHIPKSYLELGTVTLPNNSVSTIDVIIASASISSSEYVVVYPLRLGVKFEVNTKLKLANDKSYRELCTKFSNISVADTDYYLDEMIGFKQIEHKLMIKNKHIKKSVQKTASFMNKHDGTQGTNWNSRPKPKKEGSLDKEINPDLYGKGNKNGIQRESLNLKSKLKKEDSTSSLSSKDNQDGVHINEKSKCKEDSTVNQKSVKKETKVKKVEKEEKKKKPHSKHKNDNSNNENLYSQPPPSILTRVRSIAKHKSKKEKSNKLVSVEKYEDKNDKPIIENLYCQINYETLDEIQKSRPLSLFSPTIHPPSSHSPTIHPPSLSPIIRPPSSLSPTIPPPLPGNHPCQDKIGKDIYVEAVGGFYFDKASYSAVEISTWGIEEVGNCLTSLMMAEHKELFEDNLIDGKLLLDLDESVLVELGLNIFQARKLRKFVLGWRPGDTRPSTIYPPLKGFSSDDPVDWDIEDAASHMLEIDVPEMAEFCHKNQVDGELLKDICVDTPIMNFICPGKKLKVVKIRNFVIDKWRPKKKSDEPYEAVHNNGMSNDKCLTEQKTTEVPLEMHMKQQL